MLPGNKNGKKNVLQLRPPFFLSFSFFIYNFRAIAIIAIYSFHCAATAVPKR